MIFVRVIVKMTAKSQINKGKRLKHGLFKAGSVKITGLVWNLISRLKAMKENSVQIFLLTIWLLDVLEKEYGNFSLKRLLSKEIKKFGLNFNPGLALIGLRTTGPCWRLYLDWPVPVSIRWLGQATKLGNVNGHIQYIVNTDSNLLGIKITVWLFEKDEIKEEKRRLFNFFS